MQILDTRWVSLSSDLKPDTRDLRVALMVRLKQRFLGCTIGTFWIKNIFLLAIPRCGSSVEGAGRFYHLSWCGLMVQFASIRPRLTP